MVPGAVPGLRPGVLYHLKLVRAIESEKDLPAFPDFKSNAEMALHRKDPVELYRFYESKGGRKVESKGQLLWFPTFRRAGVAFWEEAQDQAEWTDAANPLDALSRWVAGEMTDRRD